MFSDEDLEEVARLLRLTRDLGVNLAGVEIILKMRRRMIEMQKQIEDLLAYVRESRRRGEGGRAPRAARSAGPLGRQSAQVGRSLLRKRQEMSDAKDLRAGIVPDILAILPLRGSVLMPHAVLPLGAGRASSVRLIEEAVQSGRLVGAVMQRDPQGGRARPGRSVPGGDRHHHSQGRQAGRRQPAPGGAGPGPLPHPRDRAARALPARPRGGRGRGPSRPPTWSWRRWSGASARCSRRSSRSRLGCRTS